MSDKLNAEKRELFAEMSNIYTSEAGTDVGIGEKSALICMPTCDIFSGHNSTIPSSQHISISQNSRKFNCQTLDSLPRIEESALTSHISVCAPCEFPILTHPGDHSNSKHHSAVTCPTSSLHPRPLESSGHYLGFNPPSSTPCSSEGKVRTESELEPTTDKLKEGLHSAGIIGFYPHHFHQDLSSSLFDQKDSVTPKRDGTFQNNLNLHSSPESHPVRFYPLILCRGPTRGLEPVQFYPVFQSCCANHIQQPFENLPLCSTHHHHSLSINESIDNNCPIHGFQAPRPCSHDSGDTVPSTLLTSSSSPAYTCSSFHVSSSSLSSLPVQTSFASDSGVLSQHHINCHHHHHHHQRPQQQLHSADSAGELKTFIEREATVVMETSTEESTTAVETNDDGALLSDSRDVSNGNRRDEVDGDEKDATVKEGDELEEVNVGVYPTSHTPPERDVYVDQKIPEPVVGEESETEKPKNQREFGGMAFTIDFGSDPDKPEITENWKKLVPYKIHAGIRERQEEQKRRRQSKELAAEEKKMEQMKKSRSHSGYMSEGHDASSVVSTDIEDASICSDFLFQRGPQYSSPKRIISKDKRPVSSKCANPSTQTPLHSKKVVRSAPPARTSIQTGLRQPSEKISSGNGKTPLKNTKSVDPKLLKGRKVEPTGSKQRTKPQVVESVSTKSTKTLSKKHFSVGSSFDADVEGTAYLIKKMLNDIPSSSSDASTVKNLGSPGITRRLKLGMKQARDVGEYEEDDDEGRAKPPSESGTYTIDEEEDGGADAGEVIKARKKIDEAFGVMYKLPVIDDGEIQTKKTQSNKRSLTAPPKGQILNSKEGKISQKNIDISCAVKQTSPILDDNENEAPPSSSMDREDSFEKLMNETSSRLNALIDATSRVIRDAKFSMKPEPQISSATFVRPRKSTTSGTIKEGPEDGTKATSPDESGFFVVSCDTPATRKARSISSSCEAGSVEAKSPPNLHLSSHSISQASSGKGMTSSFVSRRGKSADVKASSKDVSKSRDVFNITPTSSGNVDRKIARKFIAPFAKSLSNVNQTGPGREGTTFIRDVALIRDMVENTSGGSNRLGGSERVRSALGRQPSASSSSSSVAQSSMRTNRTFALRCSKAAPTGAAEVPGRSAPSARHPSRSRSVGNEEGARIKSRESSRTRLDAQTRSSQRQLLNASQVSEARQRRSSGALQEKESSSFARRDGGRFSMRLEKSESKSGETPLPTTNAWQRRKNYDPRKSVELLRSRSSSTRRVDESDKKSQKDGSRNLSKTALKVIPGKKLDKIAQMSHTVADNLNALAKNSDLERPVSLKQLPVFTHDSPSSAFSTNTIAKRRPIRSTGGGDVSPEEVSPYDSILVDSIQQVSKKVKSLADVLIGRMREDCTFEDDTSSSAKNSSTSSPNSSDPTTIWQSANPELAAILENLKKTELHLQEVHKTLFSDPSELTASSAGPLPISPHLARKTGFVPIDKPPNELDDDDEEEKEEEEEVITEPLPKVSARRGLATEANRQTLKTSQFKKTSTTAFVTPANRKKVTPFKATNHNPLNSDEYY